MLGADRIRAKQRMQFVDQLITDEGRVVWKVKFVAGRTATFDTKSKTIAAAIVGERAVHLTEAFGIVATISAAHDCDIQQT